MGKRRYTEKYRKWTKAETFQLYSIFPRYDDHELAKIFNRSPIAIVFKRRRLGLTRDRDGGKSLKELARETGYAESQLERAKRELGQRWLRSKSAASEHHGGALGCNRRYSIAENQCVELVEYLKRTSVIPDGRFLSFSRGLPMLTWGPNGLMACKVCGASGAHPRSQRHRGLGLCAKCLRRDQDRRKREISINSRSELYSLLKGGINETRSAGDAV